MHFDAAIRHLNSPSGVPLQGSESAVKAMPRTMRHSSRLILVPALAMTLAAGQLAAAPRQFTADLVHNSDVRVSRYNDVVDAMLESGAGDQARFAEVAIALMIEAFEAELGSDVADAQRGGPADPGWRAGTRAYVEQLRRIAASISAGPPIEMLRETHGGVRLVIGREQVMLNAPRLRDQAALERSVAEHVCRFSACNEAGSTVEERVDRRMAESGGAWEFGSNQRPAFTSGDGLRCIFSRIADT